MQRFIPVAPGAAGHSWRRLLRSARPQVPVADPKPVARQSILDSALEWSWSVDSSGLFLSCSPACYDMIGYRPDELIGTRVDEIMDLGELARGKAAVAGMGGWAGGWTGLVVEARHRDGSTVWFDVAGRPSHDAAGRVVGSQGSSRPLSPQSAIVMANRRTRARVDAMLASRLLMTAFQPIVSLTTGAAIGVEALTRFIAEPADTPDVWFADAASVGAGTELELLGVEIALTAAAQLPAHLYVSINASPRTCLDSRLAALIDDCALAPERIVLELTEHSPVEEYAPLRLAMAELRRRGVRIAVDDAGAGFASFRHILQLQPDMIKLDRDIISGFDVDPGRRALGSAMVSFATQIGAIVVAEGIETSGELDTATVLGITAGQGFLLGRPSVKPQDWTAWRLGGAVLPERVGAAGGSLREAGPGGRPAEPSMTAPAAVAEMGPGYDSQPGAGFASAALDALPDPTAVLDRTGTIVEVNRAWRRFALANGGRPETSGVGVSYLQVCERAAAVGDQDAREVVLGLRAVLAGGMDASEREYPCDSPTEDRRFVSRINAIGPPTGGAVVSHLDVTGRTAG